LPPARCLHLIHLSSFWGPLHWVPATTASYQSISWDIDAAYNGVEEIGNAFQPGLLEAIEKQVGRPDGAHLNLKEDLIRPLANRITVMTDFKNRNSREASASGDDDASPGVSRAVIAFTLHDQDGARGTLKKIVETTTYSPKEREFQGTTIYEFDVPETPDAPATGVTGPVCVAIAKGHLFIAAEPSLLEQILRGDGKGLTTNGDFRAVMKHCPSRTSLLVYQEPAQALLPLYNLFKSPQLTTLISTKGEEKVPDVSGPSDLIDTTKLPAFSVFAKYLTPVGGYGVMDEAGMTVSLFTLRKTER
jgi:hypothetical protein